MRRAHERMRALARLGIDADVVRLRCPDGGVADEARLVERLVPLIRGADWCVAPWEADGHPDHDATGHAAATACAATGVRLARYPVWAWHWARPERDELPWPSLHQVALAAADVAAKHAAIEAYQSQIAPLSDVAGDEAVLPEAVVARFRRAFEVVFA